MVEGAPLLREYTGNGIEGSNPFVSATNTHGDIRQAIVIASHARILMGLWDRSSQILLYILLYNMLYIRLGG